MRIKSLQLTNFRNYDNKSFEFANDFVVFYGNNGVGKTNVLEAISYLTSGSGIKKAKLSEISNIRNEKNYFEVNSLFNISNINYEIKCSYNQADSILRNLYLDDKKTSQKDLLNISKILWITPQSDKAFSEGQTSSRKLIDKLTAIFYPTHKEDLSDLNKLLQQRSFLLKNSTPKESYINALDIQITNLSVSIAHNRHLLSEKINDFFEKDITSFPKIKITISDFIADMIMQNIPASTIEEEYKNCLQSNRNPEDLAETVNKTKITLYNKELEIPAHLASTGQQKVMFFSLILACCYLIKSQKNYTPILLIDEATAHLDTVHKEKLFNELEKLNIQVFLTGVYKKDFDVLANKNTAFFQID